MNRRESSQGSSIRIAALVVAAAILLLLGVSSCQVVDPGFRGVKVTSGKVSDEVVPEGMTFKLPFVTTIHEINVQQNTESGETACFSQDLQTVKVRYAVMYKIPEAGVVRLYREFKGDAYPTLVEPRLQAALKQVTAAYNAEQLVQNRDKVQVEALSKVKTLVGDTVNIVDLSIVNIDLSDQLESAIEQKMVKQQESLAKKFELEREKQEAEITVIKATAEADAIKVKAQALTESPRVIDLEIIKKWNGIAPSTLVIGGENKGGANLILPLDAGK